MSKVADAVIRLLDQSAIDYETVHHEATTTSRDSARERGEQLGVGAKALVLRVDGDFHLFVLPADAKVDSKAIRQHLHAKACRFATKDELQDLTGLDPGAVPPFGEPILPLKLHADTSIGVRFDRVAFNAGSRTFSVKMLASDWLRLAKPEVFTFCSRKDS